MNLVDQIKLKLEQLDAEIPKKVCVCPNCGFEQETPMGVPCRSVICPKCGSPMVRKEDNNPNNQNPEDITQEALTKAILRFKGSEAPIFEIEANGEVIFTGLEPEALTFLQNLNSNPPADKAIECAKEKGECEIEINLE